MGYLISPESADKENPNQETSSNSNSIGSALSLVIGGIEAWKQTLLYIESYFEQANIISNRLNTSYNERLLRQINDAVNDMRKRADIGADSPEFNETNRTQTVFGG